MTALALFSSRDLKPANILVSSTGVCKIADFGTSILTEDGVIPQTDIRGTPAFMAPELFDPKLGYYNGFATDVYSLGECAWSTRSTGAGSAPAHDCRCLFLLIRAAYIPQGVLLGGVALCSGWVVTVPSLFPPKMAQSHPCVNTTPSPACVNAPTIRRRDPVHDGCGPPSLYG
jgi:serine/threonine protein kinase